MENEYMHNVVKSTEAHTPSTSAIRRWNLLQLVLKFRHTLCKRYCTGNDRVSKVGFTTVKFPRDRKCVKKERLAAFDPSF